MTCARCTANSVQVVQRGLRLRTLSGTELNPSGKIKVNDDQMKGLIGAKKIVGSAAFQIEQAAVKKALASPRYYADQVVAHIEQLQELMILVEDEADGEGIINKRARKKAKLDKGVLPPGTMTRYKVRLRSSCLDQQTQNSPSEDNRSLKRRRSESDLSIIIESPVDIRPGSLREIQVSTNRDPPGRLSHLMMLQQNYREMGQQAVAVEKWKQKVGSRQWEQTVGAAGSILQVLVGGDEQSGGSNPRGMCGSWGRLYS